MECYEDDDIVCILQRHNGDELFFASKQHSYPQKVHLGVAEIFRSLFVLDAEQNRLGPRRVWAAKNAVSLEWGVNYKVGPQDSTTK